MKYMQVVYSSYSRSCPCRYLDNKVFVSLANGEVIVYQREAGETGASCIVTKIDFTVGDTICFNVLNSCLNLQGAFGTHSLPRH